MFLSFWANTAATSRIIFIEHILSLLERSHIVSIISYWNDITKWRSRSSSLLRPTLSPVSLLSETYSTKSFWRLGCCFIWLYGAMILLLEPLSTEAFFVFVVFFLPPLSTRDLHASPSPNPTPQAPHVPWSLWTLFPTSPLPPKWLQKLLQRPLLVWLASLHFKKRLNFPIILENYRYFNGLFQTEVKP